MNGRGMCIRGATFIAIWEKIYRPHGYNNADLSKHDRPDMPAKVANGGVSDERAREFFAQLTPNQQEELLASFQNRPLRAFDPQPKHDEAKKTQRKNRKAALNLSKNPRTTAPEVNELLSEGTGRVENLSLSGSSAVNETYIGTICNNEHSHGVKTLNLSKCDNVDNATVLIAAEKMSIETLNVSDCDIDDRFFTSLENDRNKYTDFKTDLKSINMTGCVKITDQSMQIIAACFPAMKSMTVNKCPLITSRGLLAIRRSRPECTINAVECKGIARVAERR